MIAPADKVLPARLNLDIIKELQISRADVFTPKAVYDGRKNMFSIKELSLKNKEKNKDKNKDQAFEEASTLTIPAICHSLHKAISQFKVTLPDTGGGGDKSKGPKEYKVRLTKVAQINPE